jgi:hypothetical protein
MSNTNETELDPETIVTGIVCNDCGNTLPPHRVGDHFTEDHPVLKCPHDITYPLPTVHMNGTPKERLLEENTNILHAIHDLEDAVCGCVFHSRDYYVQDKDPYSYGTYNRALEERQKHRSNLKAFKEYIEEHINHIDSQ